MSKQTCCDTSEHAPTTNSSYATAGLRYVLHKHDASQLHYDLRLEQEGVLRSWAIPKGPGLVAGDKRLAIEVGDHAMAYGDFEGVIPAHAYGGGTVMVWDQGEWQVCGKNNASRIDFVLHGNKLKGAWTLVRMASQNDQASDGGDGKHNWLLIKRSDTENHMHDASTLTALGDDSVLSGRSMEQIAAANDNSR